MVGSGTLRRFWRDQRGVSLVEGLLAVPIVLLVIVAMVEFSYAVWQWNQTVKAIQLGARLAAVSDPIVTNIDDLTADFDGIEQGRAVPASYVSVSCGVGAAACDQTRLFRLVYGSDQQCNANYGTSVPGVCDFNPNIREQNLLITYHRSWLGYVGRPAGPAGTITLEVRDLSFDLPFIGRFIGLNRVDIPAHPVTVTTEDLSSCQDSC